MRKKIAIGSAVLLALAVSAVILRSQEDKSKRPSPPAKAECKLAGGQSVKVDYSSPRAKGRKIFGGLVPYGEVWRTGANESTALVTDADISVGGTAVPAGSYSLFTIPGENKWTLIISKKTGEWGTNYPGQESDLARIDMKAGKAPAPVENFTIAFDHSSNGCTMRIEWETTRATVDITKK